MTAYPGGGGSYTVARQNLGVSAGLLGAAAALMIDYVLVVAVGISAGVGAALLFRQRHDCVEGVYQISRVSAVDLKLMTEPFHPQSEREAVAAMSADTYWKQHPELAEERFRSHRAAGDAEALRCYGCPFALPSPKAVAFVLVESVSSTRRRARSAGVFSTPI